jgi:hypothetical protein
MPRWFLRPVFYSRLNLMRVSIVRTLYVGGVALKSYFWGLYPGCCHGVNVIVLMEHTPF